MGSPEERRRSIKFAMGGLCSKKKIADAETENNENEENTDKTPVGERRPTKGAGLLGKTEWTDDEDEEEEEAVVEDAPGPVPEEGELATENQAEENQEAQADVPTIPEANENETLQSSENSPEVKKQMEPAE